jgi:arginyl-tRNA synthetase
LKHRIEIEKAKRIIYVTDAGQAQHFAMVFDAARAAEMIPSDVELVHVPFGVVQGEDGKKFKSRSGDTVKLKDLLQDAIAYASKDMLSRQTDPENQTLTAEEQATARTIGLAAVKYADLSMNRESNYRFSYEKMLALSGNTAPYMLYAYVRIRGIQRKAIESLSIDSSSSQNNLNQLSFLKAEEMILAKHLLRWDEVLYEVARDLYPNKLCEYLFELSQKFNQFYETCPVIKAESAEQQVSRTALCTVTADVLRLSLGLLGIQVVDKL